MSEEFIRLKDWERVYNEYMKHLEDHIRDLKEEIRDDLEHEYDYTGMENAREWYEYTSMKNLLNNMNEEVRKESLPSFNVTMKVE